MKTINFNNFLILLLSLVVVLSCVQDDDFKAPDLTITEPILDGPVIGLDAVVGDYIQEYLDVNDIDEEDYDPNDDFDETITVTFEDTDNYMSGYVISSDEAGNFFEEIILQDKPENPTYGIKLLIDESPLYTRYGVGQKVFVRLNGLTIGVDNGVLALGILNGNQLDQIAGPEELDVILRSPEIATLVPTAISLDMLSDRMTNQYVTIEDAQFNRSQVLMDNPLTFAGEPTDEFDGERTLESCDYTAPIILSTSTFADFKSLPLPSGRGSINGVLTKNFFGDIFNLAINTTEDINFSDIERCDPAEFIIGDDIDCSDDAVTSTTTLFEDDFDSYNNSTDLVDAGWTLININGGSYNWGIDDFGSNTYAIGNAFGTDQVTDAWLISPEIDLDGTSEDVLNFEVQTNFDGGEVLAVYVSTDFVDLETNSNWSLLQDVDIPSGPSNGFGNFEAAGPVNLSCVDGTVRIAFRYTGSDPGITTRYHVDNIVVSGN